MTEQCLHPFINEPTLAVLLQLNDAATVFNLAAVVELKIDVEAMNSLLRELGLSQDSPRLLRRQVAPKLSVVLQEIVQDFSTALLQAVQNVEIDAEAEQVRHRIHACFIAFAYMNSNGYVRFVVLCRPGETSVA